MLLIATLYKRFCRKKLGATPLPNAAEPAVLLALRFRSAIVIHHCLTRLTFCTLRGRSIMICPLSGCNPLHQFACESFLHRLIPKAYGPDSLVSDWVGSAV